MTDEPPRALLPKDIVKENDLSTWDLAWTKGVTPWDRREVQPSLKEALDSGIMKFSKEGRALVPGCGSGTDLVYIASTSGLTTLGVEVSETAVRAANERLKLGCRHIEESKKANPKINASVNIVDFFQLETSDEEKFDLIFDHTFFCAIPPSLRNDWGRQMARLIKPGGYLVTIVFPIISYVETGPPYFLRPDHYDEPLGSNFVKVLDKIPDNSSESHVGKERLIVWKRVQG
ncbi:S-adenosyl-L-methionine-dependent methyltransferase [Crassisporium funariophilum]|nr:S-adenosyl-L-methionine-dependent methyltransferase [Crassisporium funariophilum]